MEPTNYLDFWMNQAVNSLNEMPAMARRLADAHTENSQLREQLLDAQHRNVVLGSEKETIVAQVTALEARSQQMQSEWETLTAKLSELQLENSKLRHQVPAAIAEIVPVARVRQQRQLVKRGQSPKTKPCKACGKDFHPDFFNRNYCCTECAPKNKRRTAS